MLTEATARNLERKAHWADGVQIHPEHGILPSWIDCSVTDLCNRSYGHKRACVFCPRIDPATYPNQKLHMSLDLAAKIAEELCELDYQGAVVLCGYGEPLLHPDIVGLVRQFSDVRLEIVTNGDRLTPELIGELIDAGCDYLCVSAYDGEHQVEPFHDMFIAAGVSQDRYIIRDRWYDEDQDYGVKLTNRAGVINVGNQPDVNVSRPCWYPSYSMQVDWNGDVLLCPQDWTKRTKFGNLSSQSLMEIWRSPAMHKRRMMLLKGRARLNPCQDCNADGTMHGEAHAKAWSS